MARILSVLLVAVLFLTSGLAAQSAPAPTQTSSVFISGEVKWPGQYPLVKPMTVLQLLALSGGLLPSADQKIISVVSGTERDKDGRPVTRTVNFAELMQGKFLEKNNVELRPGDEVRVRSTKGLTADELKAKLAAELKKK